MSGTLQEVEDDDESDIDSEDDTPDLDDDEGGRHCFTDQLGVHVLHFLCECKPAKAGMQRRVVDLEAVASKADLRRRAEKLCRSLA